MEKKKIREFSIAQPMVRFFQCIYCGTVKKSPRGTPENIDDLIRYKHIWGSDLLVRDNRSWCSSCTLITQHAEVTFCEPKDAADFPGKPAWRP